MKKLITLALIAVMGIGCSCETKTVERKIIGKDVASDKYGGMEHRIYFQDGEKYVSGSNYYSLKIGDIIVYEVDSCKFN